MSTLHIIKAMSKKEFSEISGIPTRTLRNYLNIRYYKELNEMTHYRKNQRLLTPKQVQWLKKKLVVVLDE